MNEQIQTITVDPEKAHLKKTSKSIFITLCTFPVIAVLAVIPTYIYIFFAYAFQFGIDEGSVLSYVFSFALPQTLYPILTLCASLFILPFSDRKFKQVVAFHDIPASDLFLSIGIFLGMGTIGTYLSDMITQIIIDAGVPVPDMTEYITTPQGGWEIFLYMIVIAILPAICEELIFRGIVCGSLKESNKTAAIILSSIAFSLIHSTVQQIPFSFIMGLFLAYMATKYDSVIPGIILHFINNMISCVFMLLYESISYEAYATAVTIYDIVSIVLGAVCGLIFVYARIKERKRQEYKEIPRVRGKELVFSTVLTLPFWLFVAIYVFQTVTNILASYYQ